MLNGTKTNIIKMKEIYKTGLSIMFKGLKPVYHSVSAGFNKLFNLKKLQNFIKKPFMKPIALNQTDNFNQTIFVNQTNIDFNESISLEESYYNESIALSNTSYPDSVLDSSFNLNETSNETSALNQTSTLNQILAFNLTIPLNQTSGANPLMLAMLNNTLLFKGKEHF